MRQGVQQAKGICKVGTEAAMFYINGDSYLGIVHWGKANECRVVGTRILNSTCLATDGIGGANGGGCALFYCQFHTFDDGRVGFWFHLGLTTRQVALVLGVLMDMRQYTSHLL